MSKLLSKLRALRQELCTAPPRTRGCRRCVDAALLALLTLLTHEHLLLLGPPGIAKSLLVRSICERIQGPSTSSGCSPGSRPRRSCSVRSPSLPWNATSAAASPSGPPDRTPRKRGLVRGYSHPLRSLGHESARLTSTHTAPSNDTSRSSRPVASQVGSTGLLPTRRFPPTEESAPRPSRLVRS